MKNIGIVAYPIDGGYGIPTSYLNFFSTFGYVTMIMHNEIEIRKDLDLLVLPGGPDVETSRYLNNSDEISLYIGKPCPFRERFDRVLLPEYIKYGTPIFGICRGHQSLAVHFGASLFQDMYHETNDRDRKKLVHKVDILTNLGLNLIKIENKSFEINSIHHQTVNNLTLPDFAQVLALHSTDSEVEALSYFPFYPAHTVQWHPEEIHDEFSITLINHLLSVYE